MISVFRFSASRVITVSEPEIEDAMRHLFADTHNVAEGAGAAALAGLLQERDRMRGRRVAVILSGGNVDSDIYAKTLAAAA
jgi:threonine dehydratase